MVIANYMLTSFFYFVMIRQPSRTNSEGSAAGAEVYNGQEDYDQWQVNWAPEDPWLISISLVLMLSLLHFSEPTRLRR